MRLDVVEYRYMNMYMYMYKIINNIRFHRKYQHHGWRSGGKNASCTNCYGYVPVNTVYIFAKTPNKAEKYISNELIN